MSPYRHIKVLLSIGSMIPLRDMHTFCNHQSSAHPPPPRIPPINSPPSSRPVAKSRSSPLLAIPLGWLALLHCCSYLRTWLLRHQPPNTPIAPLRTPPVHVPTESPTSTSSRSKENPLLSADSKSPSLREERRDVGDAVALSEIHPQHTLEFGLARWPLIGWITGERLWVSRLRITHRHNMTTVCASGSSPPHHISKQQHRRRRRRRTGHRIRWRTCCA